MTRPEGLRLHVFEVQGVWSGEGRRGELGLSGPQTVVVGVPAAFGGTVPATNPEELLLASALTCYLITLSRTLAQRQLHHLRVEATIVGEVSRRPEGLHFERIRLRPLVRGAGEEGEGRERILAALREAEDACFIARTLRPVIPYTLEPAFAEPPGPPAGDC